MNGHPGKQETFTLLRVYVSKTIIVQVSPCAKLKLKRDERDFPFVWFWKKSLNIGYKNITIQKFSTEFYKLSQSEMQASFVRCESL